MVSRRRLLQLGAGVVAGVAGCAATDAPTDEPTERTPTDEPTERTPGELSDWEPAWRVSVEGRPLGIDHDDRRLYVTVGQSEAGAVAAVDPADRTVVWRTDLAGPPVGGSHAGSRAIARGQWGVTLAGRAVYAVGGNEADNEPTTLHALDRTDGSRRWTFTRPRELGVVGVTDEQVVVSGRAFLTGTGTPPPTHHTPDEPVSVELYGLDRATGERRWTHELFDLRETHVTNDAVFAASDAGLVSLTLDGDRQGTLGVGPATALATLDGRGLYLTGETLHGVTPAGSTVWERDLPIDSLVRIGDRVYAGGNAVLAVGRDGTVEWRENAYGRWLLPDPDRDTLYTRSGVEADAATAYAMDGTRRWRFRPFSNNAWPEAATREAVAVTAITGGESFYTLYAVGADGRARAALDIDTIFDAAGLDDRIYVGGDNGLLALD